ncbi:hypothetical protein [Rheinheimera sp. F8]|uniref:hypothetical protein n=1 Tax=Rheinheimera sp. F8 TaxID=1763998 RepID=UPI001AD7EE17|nr:hypothetical protein [Rheinheimera sp. F8]
MKEIINPDVVIESDIVRKELLLKEDGADSKIKKLYITNVPENAFAFTLDYQPGGQANRWFKQLSPYVDVANAQGVNKGCDLIILWQVGERPYALVFDLKSDKPKQEATQKQLNNSEVFLKYLLAMVNLHYGIATDTLQIKKAIGTTDNRAVRKGATYRPNATATHLDGYHIEVITPRAYQTGYIPLPQLAR